MTRIGRSFKPLMWLMAMLLPALVAGCGGGGDSPPPAASPSPPVVAVGPAGVVCAGATGEPCVNLGATGGTFTILTTAGITNTGTHGTAITGNIGASPITAAAMTGVFCSEITGKIVGVDAAYTGSGDLSCFAGAAADKTTVDNAILDTGNAFIDVDSRTPGLGNTDLGAAGNINGLNLVPGVYKWTTGVSNTGNVTLTGGPTDVWVFQIAGGITHANNATVTLAGGALAKNIFWRTAGVAALGTNSTFEGIILSGSSITLATGAKVNGRLYATSSATLDANMVTRPGS